MGGGKMAAMAGWENEEVTSVSVSILVGEKKEGRRRERG